MQSYRYNSLQALDTNIKWQGVFVVHNVWAQFPVVAAGEYLDYIVQQAMSGGQGGAQEGQQQQQQGGAAGLLSQLQRTANSLQYFMRSLTK